jgi:hypothetical protein
MSRNASSIADFPEVGFAEIATDLLQACFCMAGQSPQMANHSNLGRIFF